MRDVVVYGFNPLAVEVYRDIKVRGRTPIFAIDDEDKFIAAVGSGYAALFIDLRHDAKLREVGAGSGLKVLFCVDEDTSKNLITTIAARAIDKELVIVARGLGRHERHKLILAGANKVLDPYELAAKKFAMLYKKPAIVEMLDNVILKPNELLGDEDLELGEIVIGPSSSFCGKIADTEELRRTFGLVAIGIVDKERGERMIYFVEGLSHKLDTGDVLVVLGRKKDIIHATRVITGEKYDNG
ncbi:MAG: NAD-binding protein [Campylobacterales bacterium]